MRQSPPSAEQVLALPDVRREVAAVAWGDQNGHVNVLAHYEFHMRASEAAINRVGITDDYRRRHQQSVFSLEHHIAFQDEVLIGHEVSAHFRMLDRSDKLLHAVTFMVNRTTGRIANSIEFIEAHVDLTTRRACAFRPEVADALDDLLDEHRQLGWAFPGSDGMSLRSRASS